MRLLVLRGEGHHRLHNMGGDMLKQVIRWVTPDYQ